MELTYKDAVAGVNTYVENKTSFEQALSVELSGAISAPNALESAIMLENVTDYARKARFVDSLLVGLTLTVKHKGKSLVSFIVEEGVPVSSNAYFMQYPGVYHFVVDAIFSIFLKNSYPLFGESQQAE